MSSDKEKIHFVGIGGVGTGSLAIALAQAGHTVTGSDKVLYEPMKSVIQNANIEVFEGFEAKTAKRIEPDKVIIGNVIRKENPEAQAWIRSGIPFLSFPEAVRRYLIQNKTSIVCAGTHGKTTTTNWIAYLLSELERKPSYLIGGVPQGLATGSCVNEGKEFVGEGDEYDSAFFDKGPKFLHYKPDFLVLTNIEFDHADIYRDLAHVQASFEKLICLVPGDGLCVAYYEDQHVMEVIPNAICPVQTYGFSEGAMWRLTKIEESREGFIFELGYKGRPLGKFETPLFGKHNLLNLVAGIVCAIHLGEDVEKIRAIVPTFKGPKRRQQILLQEPIMLIDDFAHHPTEVKASLTAVRSRIPDGKLWALFEPRSATARRRTHQEAYVQAFDSADHILVTSPYKGKELKEDERFQTEDFIHSLEKRGKQAQSFDSPDALLEYFLKNYQKGDVVLVMSNGEFDKIQEKAVKALKA